jgi:hypothetical protein
VGRFDADAALSPRDGEVEGGRRPRWAGRSENLKFYERTQEVVENKGPGFWKANRSMKTNKLDDQSQEVIEGQSLKPN